MLKIRDMYKSPPSSEHYLACLLSGVCVAATASVLFIVAGYSHYDLLNVPIIVGISLAYARRTRENRIRLRSKDIQACTIVNLFVLVVFIILFK
jgi:hypothetical protein